MAVLIAAWSPATRAQEGSIEVERDGMYGCTNIDQLEGLMNFEARGDRDGLNKALPMARSLGVCVVFDRGEKLSIVPAGARQGIVRVRRAGNDRIYFIVDPARSPSNSRPGAQSGQGADLVAAAARGDSEHVKRLLAGALQSRRATTPGAPRCSRR